MKSGVLFVAATAVVASLGLHLAGFIAMPEENIQIKGGAQAEMARLGNSFESLSEGVSSPVAPDEVSEPVQDANEAEPVEPDAPVEEAVVEVAQTPVTERSTAQPVENSTNPAIVAENTINPVVPQITEAVVLPSLPVTPPVITAAASPIIPTAAKPAAKPVEPLETVKSQAPSEVLQARPETRRPATRPKPKRPKTPVVRKPKPVKPKATKPKAAKPKPAKPRVTKRKPTKAAGSTQTATRGQASGSATGRATKSAKRGKKRAAAGNAAAANYGGKVMRKIQRTRKERTGANGKTVVGFKVSSSGAATSVRVLRGSGSAKLDSIALRHVRRSSPFPKPPKGARRSFSVTIVARR